MSTRAEREARGRRGETLAAWFLRCKGWRILARRIKTARGEIDLIARRGKVVAYVEVKWRADEADLDLAIDAYRLRRVGAAAEAVSHRFAKASDVQRIDVLLLAPGRFPRHMANALTL